MDRVRLGLVAVSALSVLAVLPAQAETREDSVSLSQGSTSLQPSLTSPQPSLDQGEGAEVEAGFLTNQDHSGSTERRSPLAPLTERGELSWEGVGVSLPKGNLGGSLLNQPATTIADWIAQIEASLVQITGVRVEDEAGLQVILETAEGSLDVPETRSIDNALIADIPNATIAEEFSQANLPPHTI